MGVRGPKAKPVRLELVRTNDAKRRRSWQARGLTRPQRVIRFVESLPCTQGYGEGGPLFMHPFQKDIITGIYGPTRSDGRRMVRTALVTMPRKQGKSTLSAALVMAHLCGPMVEPRGQIYSAATDRQQAGIIFAELLAMLDRRPSLAERLHVQRWNKTITDTMTGTVYQALSSDSRKAHGLNPSMVVADELAQWRSPELYHNLVTGMGGRSEPLMVVISTRSADPNHIMTELVDYGRKVLDGVIDDPTFHASIYAAPPDADWLDEDVWRACNPAIDAGFRSIEEMRVAAAQAQRMPAREPVFRNLYLNQAVDTRSDRFIPIDEWLACQGDVDPEALRGRPCYGGLDLSSTQDLTALVLYFPDDGAVLAWFWAPADRLEQRQERDKAPYVTWAAERLLEAPSGRAIDRYAIARRLGEIVGAYDVRKVAYDRWRVEDLQHVLTDEGVEVNLEPFGQGYRDMGPAIDVLEAAILNRTLRHGGHPILTWCVSNAVVTADPSGARKFDKARAIERIDGLVALAMAIGCHAKMPPPKTYDFSLPAVLTA
jgi:phage terminase large subunit-like protein